MPQPDAESSDNEPLDVPITIPPPSGVYAEPFSLSKMARLSACFGPAAIAASVSIGAGETLIVVVTGAWAQYKLLWLVLLAVLVKGVFTTYMLGRYTAVSGEYVGHALARVPGPRGWLLIFLIVVELTAAGPVCKVIARPCGNLLTFVLADYLPGERIAGGLTPESIARWEKILAVTFVLAAVGLSLRLSYRWLEKQNLIICGVLVAGTLLVSLWVRPDFSRAAAGTVTPHLPLTPHVSVEPDPVTGQPAPLPPEASEYNLAYLLLIVTIFGYVGNTVFGYMVYSNWVGVRRWGLTSHAKIDVIRQRLTEGGDYSYLPSEPRQIADARRLLAPLRWDVALGAVVLLIVTASFMMTGAQVLYPRVAESGLPAWKELLTEQRHVWREIHAGLVPVYYVCMLAALWGTLNALPEIWARVTHEFVSAISPRAGRWGYGRFKTAIVLLALVPTIVFLVLGTDLQLLAAVVVTLSTNLAVALVCGAALYLNWRLPPGYRPGKVTLAAGALATCVLTLAAVGGMTVLARKLGVL